MVRAHTATKKQHTNVEVIVHNGWTSNGGNKIIYSIVYIQYITINDDDVDRVLESVSQMVAMTVELCICSMR